MSQEGHGLDEFKSKFSPDQEVVHLREEVKALERKIDQERKATGEARLKTIELTEAISSVRPSPMKYKATNKSESPIDYVVQLTDLHIGEVVQANEVEGLNECNPDIAMKRLTTFGQSVIDHVASQRAGYNIPRLRILGTADYISGDIHEELKVTNAYPSPRQAVVAGYVIGELISMLAPHFGSVEADLLTLDNHGRMTRKPQAAQGGENNWSYVVAHIAKQYCARIENVKVNIHASPTALVQVGSERYLMFHGHQIRGWAGLPYYGFDRRTMMEAVKRMGVPRVQFTKMVMGHFHTAANAPHWILGGSLSGTNVFDHSCGRHARPHQTSWLVHPKHGEFSFTRWWL